MMTADDPMIGRTLGHARIQRKLGAGGMGAVYLAHHDGLNKPVAVKVMSAELARNPEFVARFLREARLAARLEHPNVVQVFDVGEEGGLYFITMQYVEGRGLDGILKERRTLSLPEALSIAKRVAVALGAAHKLGIIHRDIKPANILISKEGLVKVADFGLAKDEEAGRTLSGTGQIVGTPYYMSPEQAQGEKVDARSDLYSLGATLYHMITGKRAFEGHTPLSVVLKQIHQELVPPREIDPSVPENVSALIERMMAKDPAARPASAEELVRELDALKTGGPSRIRKTVGGWPLSSRRAALIALPVAGLLALGVILGILLSGGEPPAPAPAAPPTAAAPPPVVAPEAPKPAPPAPPPPDPKEAVLSRIKEAQERRSTEDLLARCDDFLRAMQKKDSKAVEGFLNWLSFGDSAEAAVKEMFARPLHETSRLERWEYQDVQLRKGLLLRAAAGSATVVVTYHLGTPVGPLVLRDQAIHWTRKNDGQWYITKRAVGKPAPAGFKPD